MVKGSCREIPLAHSSFVLQIISLGKFIFKPLNHISVINYNCKPVNSNVICRAFKMFKPIHLAEL